MLRQPLALAAAAALAASTAVVLAGPASASTGVTFVVSGSGTLSVSEPSTTADLGTATPSPTGTVVSGHLGSTTVTDNRASIAGWTVKISSTDFTDSATHTILASKAVAYLLASDTPTVQGVVVPTAGTYVSPATGLALSNSGQNFITATATGSNSTTYNPSMQITIDSSVIAGTYTGTVTQTVS